MKAAYKYDVPYDKTRLPWEFNEDTRDPSGEEIHEWMRCAASVIYFIHNYCFIQDPVKGRVPFKLYPFQRVTLKLFLSHLFNLVLKPRQMGLSWLVAAFALWFTMFRTNKNVVIISMKEDVAIRFLDKIKYMYIHLPGWLKAPLKQPWNTKTIVFMQESRITSMPTSEEAGRSEGVSLLIIDEAAFVRWIDVIWGSAFPTLSTGGMAIALSTANGMGNWFANKWLEALGHISDFNPIKLHWRMHPERDEEWYRRQRRNLGPALTAQEVDCDFLNSGRPVFDTTILVDWSELLRLRKPLQVLYAPETYDDYEGLYGKRAEGLYIFKKPEVGKVYLLALDCSSGDGNDFNAIQVCEWVTGEQCAEMRVSCKPNQLSKYAQTIGKLFNYAQIVCERNGVGLAVVQKLVESHYPNLYTYMKEEASLNKDAKTLMHTEEQTLMVGFTTTTANRPVLITVGEELIREHDAERGKSIPSEVLLINSLRLINEMLVFNHQETGKPSPRANDGYNDDLVMAWFILQLARANYKPKRQMPVIFA